jgi:predicted site-specific integrase-resolvase
VAAVGKPGDPWRESMRARGWIVLSEASKATGIATSTLRTWVADGKIVAKKVGGIVFVDAESLNRAAGVTP